MKTTDLIVEYVSFAVFVLIVCYLVFSLVPKRVHVYEEPVTTQQQARADCMAQYLTEGEMKDGIASEAEAFCSTR